ncbi:unnamed protein product [Darwinula stevensoni]|uniref:Uncharacterized protein n=1 Tax=Darwinula stevensoni TaxID=69355 RepID=A0A7R8WZG5_9CRUS|nr:unnamed protein product [Darwinula stevensoni]CAG0880557.1 unnamed protein product [Darwinula stevensoni]
MKEKRQSKVRVDLKQILFQTRDESRMPKRCTLRALIVKPARRNGVDLKVNYRNICGSKSWPIACQETRPRVNYEKWPLLLCCKEELCNGVPPDSVMTTTSIIISTLKSASPSPSEGEKEKEKLHHLSAEDIKKLVDQINPQGQNRVNSNPLRLSPLSYGVLGLGLTMMIVVGFAAFYILRRMRSMPTMKRKYQGGASGSEYAHFISPPPHKH